MDNECIHKEIQDDTVPTTKPKVSKLTFLVL